MSRQGNILLKLNGYTYSARKGTGPRIRWRCSTHNRNGCNALVHTLYNVVIHIKEVHTHDQVI